jgi:hypothetical protein
MNNEDRISIVWEFDDILLLAADRIDGVTPSREQCREVLRRAKKYHDANVGISWDVLSGHLDNVLGENK